MLYIIPTPIGNLEDITLRALDTLKKVDAIFCEDTRRTLNLMTHFGVSKPLFRYNEHNERSVANCMSWLRSGKSAALVTDGGSPCISDPGRKLVSCARAAGVKVVPLPGPSAVVTAAAGSGLPVDSFVFLGFLPRGKGKIVKALASAFSFGRTVILYESPHRIKKFLELVRDNFSDETKVVIAREISKIYEEFSDGTPSSLLGKFGDSQVKGEIVVLLYPPKDYASPDTDGGSSEEDGSEVPEDRFD